MLDYLIKQRVSGTMAAVTDAKPRFDIRSNLRHGSRPCDSAGNRLMSRSLNP